jgi:hypothetical protein
MGARTLDEARLALEGSVRCDLGSCVRRRRQLERSTHAADSQRKHPARIAGDCR